MELCCVMKSHSIPKEVNLTWKEMDVLRAEGKLKVGLIIGMTKETQIVFNEENWRSTLKEKNQVYKGRNVLYGREDTAEYKLFANWYQSLNNL